MEDMPLIAFQHRARHFHGLGEAALAAPVEEEADMHAPVLHRVFGVVANTQIFEMFLQ